MDAAMLQALVEWTTPERTRDVLSTLTKHAAPSQMASEIRGPLIEQYLRDWDLLDSPKVDWTANWQGTGNGILRTGSGTTPPIWYLSHWDTISFLMGPPVDEHAWNLIPFFEHFMVEGEEPGIVWGSDAQGHAQIVGRGRIIGGDPARFVPETPLPLGPGMRVAFDIAVEEPEPGLLRGQLDDSLGCAAQLLAAGFLAHYTDVASLFAFTDEEEGPVAVGSTSFSRGSRRLIHRLPPPYAAVVCDGHQLPSGGPGPQLGDGALACEYASRARGGVTPPWLWRSSLDYVAQHGAGQVLLQPNIYGSCSRSDCISMMEVTPNILLWSAAAPGGRHFMGGANTCSIHDVCHLARALVLAAFWAQEHAGRQEWGK